MMPLAAPVMTMKSASAMRRPIAGECGDGVGTLVVERPDGVEGGHVEQLARLLRGAGDDDLAVGAGGLGPLVTVQQERQEDRADVIDRAQVEDQPRRRVVAEG